MSFAVPNKVDLGSCKCSIFAAVLSSKIVIILNYTTKVLKQGRYEDLCIRCSEIKDMAVRLQTVSMISWNLPTITATIVVPVSCDYSDNFNMQASCSF